MRLKFLTSGPLPEKEEFPHVLTSVSRISLRVVLDRNKPLPRLLFYCGHYRCLHQGPLPVTALQTGTASGARSTQPGATELPKGAPDPGKQPRCNQEGVVGRRVGRFYCCGRREGDKAPFDQESGRRLRTSSFG